MLLCINNDDQLFLFFIMFSYIMLMSNLTKVNIHFMDMNRPMLIVFSIIHV
jgi:hypothetical protein